MSTVTTSTDICPIHEWPLYQCPPECRDEGQPQSKTWTEHPPPDYDGPRPTADSILISPGGIVHRLDACAHLPDLPWLAPPTWGWTTDASRWHAIGSSEVRATQGNTSRVAHRRCLDCDESF
jgi:hypothetical protein